MITQKQAKDICSANVITDIQSLQVIQRYIFDKKGVTVEINRPTNLFDIQLMNTDLETASNFYLG